MPLFRAAQFSTSFAVSLHDSCSEHLWSNMAAFLAVAPAQEEALGTTRFSILVLGTWVLAQFAMISVRMLPQPISMFMVQLFGNSGSCTGEARLSSTSTYIYHPQLMFSTLCVSPYPQSAWHSWLFWRHLRPHVYARVLHASARSRHDAGHPSAPKLQLDRLCFALCNLPPGQHGRSAVSRKLLPFCAILVGTRVLPIIHTMPSAGVG